MPSKLIEAARLEIWEHITFWDDVYSIVLADGRPPVPDYLPPAAFEDVRGPARGPARGSAEALALLAQREAGQLAPRGRCSGHGAWAPVAPSAGT